MAGMQTPCKAEETTGVHDQSRWEAGLAEEGRRRPPSQPDGRIPRPREYGSCDGQHRRDGGVAADLRGAGVAELCVLHVRRCSEAKGTPGINAQ